MIEELNKSQDYIFFISGNQMFGMSALAFQNTNYIKLNLKKLED